jgi:hypothetical protein
MAITEIYPPGMPPNQGGATGFQKGHPRYGGRPKGSRNKVMQAANPIFVIAPPARYRRGVSKCSAACPWGTTITPQPF